MANKQQVDDLNYIAHGSDEHAAMLGLVKGTGGKWQLEDITQYGPNARKEFLDAVLAQKVSELETLPTPPKNAPSLWVPADEPATGIV
jgi:hypothetical protein